MLFQWRPSKQDLVKEVATAVHLLRDYAREGILARKEHVSNGASTKSDILSFLIKSNGKYFKPSKVMIFMMSHDIQVPLHMSV